ncbi:hypothetical protein AC230_22980 [Streptomyces caatingaensis]|uniref:Uncharacterized protein n=1 Tax=Streptomyces caatingaensis TaxID=1678637 RepID=A0A0K9X9B8_9ACTN|nr:hypothetical protein AC230_22980 [Streptomyces caatingaensis]
MDERSDRGGGGVVMGHEGPNVQLRPPRGGREREADPRKLRLATASERRESGAGQSRPTFVGNRYSGIVRERR